MHVPIRLPAGRVIVFVAGIATASCRDRAPAPRPEPTKAPVAIVRPVVEPSSVPAPATNNLPPLYTDDEALAFARIAPTAVPSGQAIPKEQVLRTMNIDVKRLRDWQVYSLMNTVLEVRQLSEHYNISWRDGGTSRTEPCIRHPRCPIYDVLVQPRIPPR
jgi:hypothetical protein